MCVRLREGGRLRWTKRERGEKKRRIEPNRSRINRSRASAEQISRTLRGLEAPITPACSGCLLFFFNKQGGSFPRLCKYPLTALCHLHRLRRAVSRSRNSDSGRGGAAKPPGEAALPGRGFAHTHTRRAARSGMRMKRQWRGNVTLSPSASTRTFYPRKLRLYSAKLLPRTRQGPTQSAAARKVVSSRICCFFLCLNTVAKGVVLGETERQPF